jgi:hypothetical protein
LKNNLLRAIVCVGLTALFSFNKVEAQNPFITNQYSADPSARVFGDRVYVYPSHDILATKEKGRLGWFCMEDYHAFSSSNLTDWEDHGVIVSQNTVAWVKPDSYSMWAPDCIFRNGKYYFYFPSNPKDTTGGKRFTIGVAVADHPAGPFVPETTPIKGVKGIDPNVFIDKDGQAYLYWSQGNIYGAKLKDNMLELASDVKTLGDLPTIGLKEGPYLFERNGLYYLTYPHVENKIERLEYAIGDNPLGPFKFAGVIMDESPTGCWTNHHSIIEFKNQWYLFYHHNDFSSKFDKARSVRVDSLFFNADGSIKKVVPTLRGVGVTPATKAIQLDRYSEKSSSGSHIDFLDTSNTFLGWKCVLENKAAWIQYNSVDFGTKKLAKATIRATAINGGTMQIRLDKLSNPVIAEFNLPANKNWTETTITTLNYIPGIHNIIVSVKDDRPFEIDWVSFK